MSLIGRFEHLPNRPKSDEARPLLEKIASQVKPIMSKRSWKVGTLAEFLPSNPSLLGNNMNAGQRINLRLRPPGDVSTFYEYDQLVLVMLHELTHIEHGPHDAKFYKLLGELEEEFWDLKRKGYSGEGFHGTGSHLSGFKVPEHIGKAKGLAAAQKRLETQRKIGKGGVLGGRGTGGRTMQEVLAEAAERRIRDDKACNTSDAGHAREVEEEVRKAAEESVGVNASDLPRRASGSSAGSEGSRREEAAEEEATTAIDATSREKYGPSSVDVSGKGAQPNGIIGEYSSAARLVGKRASSARSAKNGSDRPYSSTGALELGTKIANTGPTSGLRSDPARPIINGTTQPLARPDQPKQNKSKRPAVDSEWSCPTCTLLNSSLSLQCEACTTPKPAKHGDGEVWWCEFCGAGPRDMGFWSCAECGWVRKWGLLARRPATL